MTSIDYIRTLGNPLILILKCSHMENLFIIFQVTDDQPILTEAQKSFKIS